MSRLEHMGDLGKFTAGFQSWRKVIASVSDADARWDIFGNAAADVAGFVSRGLDKGVAVDELFSLAEAQGLLELKGEDGVQGLLARAFEHVEPELVPDRIDQPQRINGQDHAEVVKAPAKPIGASVYTFPDPAQIPPRAWLYGEHYIRGAVTATVAPGGTGKTTLSLFEAITMAVAGLCVWYLSGEDPRVEIDRRIAAHMQHHNLDPMQIAGRLFVDDRASFPIKLTKSARSTAVVFDDEWMKAFERAIERDRIDVVIIDPFVAFHTAAENDNAAMDAIIKRLGETCTRFNCNVEVSHHVRKPAVGMAEITVDDARGGGALVNATRSCRVINRMPSDIAVQENIPPDKRTGYLRLDNGKRNMAPPGAASWWHLVSVLIGNGADNVQAIESYRMRGPFDGWMLADTDAIAELVKAGDMRADSRSDKWLGHAVLERLNLDGSDKAHFAKANKMINAWLANRLFKKVKLIDPENRKPRPYFVPMDYPEPHDLGDKNA
jgi:hypothetical protein